MKGIRNLFRCLLVLCIVAAIAPVKVHASTASGRCGDNITWKLSSTGVLTLSGTGDMWSFDTSDIDDYIFMGQSYTSYKDEVKKVIIKDGIVSLAEGAFSACENLTSVSIGNTVTYIGKGAFLNCVKLPAVSIPDSVEYIGRGAFSGCKNLTDLTIGNSVKIINPHAFYNCTALTAVKIPGSVEEICDKAFYWCRNLKNLTIENGVKTIGDEAFYYCTSLVNVTIPSSVTSIGNSAFSECYKLKKVTIGTGLTTVGEAPFTHTECMEGISVATGNKYFSSDEHGALYNKDKTILYHVPGMFEGHYTIPDTVTTVRDFAFSMCMKLYGVTIPDSVKDLGEDTFNNCEYLNSVVIPDSITTLKRGVFAGCWSLDNVVIPEGVTSIGVAAFSSCFQLDAVVIPSTVTSIGDWAFDNCEKAEKLVFLGNAPSISSNAFLGMSTSVYYPSGNSTWTTAKRTGYGGELEWYSYAKGSKPWDDVRDWYAPETKLTIDASGKIKLNWEYYGIYHIYRATSKSGPYTLLASIDELSFIDENAKPGKTYYYYCINIDDQANSSLKSNIVSGTCKLAKPTITVGNILSTGKPKVSWNAVEGAVKYKVYYSTSKDGSYTALSTTTGTSITHASAAVGKTYYYKVIAIAENTSANSAYSVVKTVACTLAQPVVTLSNVASTGKIKIKWNAVDGAVKYKVYCAASQNGTYTALKTTTATSLTHASAVAGKTYYYKVIALADTSSANSAFSTIKSLTCDLAQPAITLGNVASTGKNQISWNAVEGAVKYKVYYSTSKDGTYTALKTVTGTNLIHTSAAAGKTYYYKVIALAEDTSANSAFSAIKSQTCDLARPTVTVSLNTSGKPVLNWNAVEGAVKYKLYIYDANGNQIKTSTTTNTKATHSTAVTGETYRYQLVAMSSVSGAHSAKSAAVSIQSK